MHRTIKKYFIPNADNNFHPHILHTKRAVLYGAFFTTLKVFLIGFALFLPAEVFVLPDVLAEEQNQIIVLTNALREKNNRSVLNVSPKLNISSQYKADDMAKKRYFAHTNNNKTVTDWIDQSGYDFEVAGENLAVGYSTAAAIVAAWEKSPSHYSNLVDSDFKDIGVGLAGGVYNGEPTIYIAQHFAAPVEATPVADNAVYSITTNQRDIVLNQHENIASNNSSVRKSVLAEKIVTVHQTVPIVIASSGSTPVDKYIQARTVLTPITRIFDVSRAVFFGAMIFFIVALALKIFIEIKKQHPHVIAQTALLIGLLFVFWKY